LIGFAIIDIGTKPNVNIIEVGFLGPPECYQICKLAGILGNVIEVYDHSSAGLTDDLILARSRHGIAIYILSLSEVAVLLQPFLPVASEKIISLVLEKKKPESPLFLRKT
jgi:hypothetical protein